MRDIDRILSSGGRFREKRRQFERFDEHPDARVRGLVDGILRPPQSAAFQERDEERPPAYDPPEVPPPFGDSRAFRF